MIKVCCVCRRVQRGATWVMAGEGRSTAGEQVTHGYCPHCFEEFMTFLSHSERILRAGRKKSVAQRNIHPCVCL